MSSNHSFTAMSAKLDDLLLIETLRKMCPREISEASLRGFLKEAQPHLIDWVEQNSRSNKSSARLSTAA